ncbi:unnamed protein product, partial [Bubo scandiacus]
DYTSGFASHGQKIMRDVKGMRDIPSWEKEKSDFLLPLEIHQIPKPKYFTMNV